MNTKIELLRTATVLIAGIGFSVKVTAQSFPSGYVDPAPVLEAASREIGEINLQCVKISGNGYAGVVGQSFESAVNVDWPRRTLSNYSRAIDFDAQTIREEFDREPGRNPASWKYGLGWQGGTPTQRNVHQTFIVSGNYGWHIDGHNGEPVPMSAEQVEMGQLEIWMNPPGFLKAARLPGANPKAVWRWELGEMGRDGPTVNPQKVHVVSITFGKYQIDATINGSNQIQRIHTMIAEPALGDFNFEHESTNQQSFGSIKFPTVWHSHQGWDDNFGFDNISAGHNAFGGRFSNVEINSCGAPIAVPDVVRENEFTNHVTVDELKDGVYLLGGSAANSVAIEFNDYVAVFEAPTNEARSLAVIETIAELIPNKPIRYLINSHQHFDHIGGLRAYLHIGATIITQRKNIDFLNHDVLNYRPRTVEPDIVSQWPPTELAEGYNFEAFNENYVLTDGNRTLRVYYVQPLEHVDGMAMAFLDNEKMLMEADLFNTHESLPESPSREMITLYREIRLLDLNVETIVPIHGVPASMAEFLTAMGSVANECPILGAGGSLVWGACP